MTGEKNLIRDAGLHRKKPGRLQWMQKSGGEACPVVKGTNRRVVVVRSPDERIFEQAIFIIRDDYLRKDKNSVDKLLEEASRTANDYIRKNAPKRQRRHRLRRGLYAAAGVAAAGLTWLAVHFAGVLF